MKIARVKVELEDGTTVGISLEDFAKLFTYGETFSLAAMRHEEPPDYEIRVRQTGRPEQ